MNKNLNVSEIIPNKLYFALVSEFFGRDDTEYFYFSTDDTINHPNINSYFGPPCLSDVYRYCLMVNGLLNSKPRRKVLHCSLQNQVKKNTNAIFLIGCFLLIRYKLKPDGVINHLKIIKNISPLEYCDTTGIKDAPTLKMEFFFQAVEKAIALNWFNMDTFNAPQYDYWASLEGGDITWILPNKFFAFSGPTSFEHIEKIIAFCKIQNVKAVIRLSKPMYDGEIFQKNDIRHYDLYFPDCSCPSQEVVENFLRISECTIGPIGVHCKAGMGRTGTLIAAYIIKNYLQMNALEAVAWIRLCRPGSVVGLQQRFLQYNNMWLKQRVTKCVDDMLNISS